MCGFAGVISWDEKYRVSRETLAKMSAAIAHRGPDGEGTYFSPDVEITPDQPQVALAHRRLAIIDPDPRGNQPFTDGEGRWLVYNGEIYNYRELRSELKALKPEYQWRTDCDTEVLLVAYGVWGEKCVEHFNGMFAFAIWDGVKKELFLARDRMGQKPLYFAAIDKRGSAWEGVPGRTANGVPFDDEDLEQRGRVGRRIAGDGPAAIAFASELSSIVAVPWVDRSLSPSGVEEYLRWGYRLTLETIYCGAQTLPPRVWFTARPSGFETATYFETYTDPIIPESPPTAGAAATTRRLVLQAVKRQLVSDVPIGCLLSGGVDSSVIAAGMKHAGAETRTFSIGFDDPRYDETEFAAAVAKHLGTTHHHFVVRPRVAKDLPKLAAVFGEPFADSSALPTHYLARATRARVKVALGGDGGDELFGGYDRYRAMLIARRYGLLLETAKLARVHHLVRLGGRSNPKSKRERIARLIQSFKHHPGERYAAMMRIFPESTLRAMLKEPPREWPFGGLLGGEFKEVDPDVVRASLALDRHTYLPGDLLTKVDRASMLHALEVRSPFMDHELVQFAAGLTTDQLLKGGPKRMLREAFADDLPAWVFKRKKMGFAVPIGDWFRAELKPMLHDHLFASDALGATHFNMAVVRRLVDEHEQFKVDHSQRLYALLMLELWWKTQRI